MASQSEKRKKNIFVSNELKIFLIYILNNILIGIILFIHVCDKKFDRKSQTAQLFYKNQELIILRIIINPKLQ